MDNRLKACRPPSTNRQESNLSRSLPGFAYPRLPPGNCELDLVCIPPGSLTARARRKEALLLVREGEAFLFAGHRKNSPLVGLGVVYDFSDVGGTDDRRRR